VDFFDIERIAATVVAALADPAAMAPLRQAARQTIVDDYDLGKVCLPQLVTLIDGVAAGTMQPFGSLVS
jgi:hypothetical protein